MNYLSVEDVKYRWGDVVLFNGVSFGISEGDKVALVARNGAGKSTLLGMLAGSRSHSDIGMVGANGADVPVPDSGKITWNENIRVGWLQQEPQMNPEHTVLEEVFASDSPTATAVREYEKALAEHNDEALPALVERMDALKAWDYESRAKQMLARLSISDFGKQVGQLSGGQRKRIAIASLLLSEPDFLILDEPTNHLDVEIIEWLEEYLTRSTATLLMVTHDRYFLDRVCSQIIELDNQTTFTYNGNYAYYIAKRQERLDAHQAEAAKARNLLRREQEWMNRQPQARGTKAQYRIDAFEVLKEKARKRAEERSFALEFGSTRLGRKVVDAYNLHKAYNGKVVIGDFSYKFARGERVAIVGPNGSGKTTLLNMLTGREAPDTGYIETGDTVVTGYYRQGGISVEPNKTVLEVIEDIADQIEKEGGHTVPAAQFLRQFLFPNEMHHVRVEKLSGGERKRLYLVTVLMKNPNFLILDEPTNDLDILSLNVLEDYLTSFGGTVIIVSHDRFFVDKIADHLFVLDGQGGVKDFPGDYTDLIAYQREQRAKEREAQAAERQANQAKAEKTASQDTRRANRHVKLTYAQKKELEKIDAELPKLNARREEIEALLSGGATDPAEVTKLSDEYAQIKYQIDEMEMRWLELDEIQKG